MERIIQKKTVSTYQATINLGLKKFFSEELIPAAEVIAYIQHYQKKRGEDAERLISLNIQQTSIVCMDQNEPHLMIQFINYPKSDLNNHDIKAEAIHLAENLMREFNQHRSVIVCTDETVLLEENDKLDYRITGFD
jgi:hypothetical protein